MLKTKDIFGIEHFSYKKESGNVFRTKFKKIMG